MMYLLGHGGGWRLQENLWEWIDNGLLVVHDLSTSERLRTRQLMSKYADAPMGFADASLVAIAESLNIRTIFTLDTHFRIYPP